MSSEQPQMKSMQEKYMRLAVREAEKAGRNGDVPIGCVIVYDGTAPDSRADRHAAEISLTPGTVIGRGYNRRNRDLNALMHAEIIAVRKACRKMQDWRLEDCTMYVTLEPCPMCAGAIMQARVEKLIYGAADPKAGAIESLLKLFQTPGFNHKVSVRSGVLASESSKLLQDFFRGLRK